MARKAAVGSVDELTKTDTIDPARASTVARAPIRNSRRPTRDASRAASSVRPWRATVTTRSHGSDGPEAMKM